MPKNLVFVWMHHLTCGTDSAAGLGRPQIQHKHDWVVSIKFCFFWLYHLNLAYTCCRYVTPVAYQPEAAKAFEKLLEVWRHHSAATTCFCGSLYISLCHGRR